MTHIWVGSYGSTLAHACDPVPCGNHRRSRRAWDRAAEDLGIDVLTEDVWLEVDGQRFEAVALIRSFGRPNGTVILEAQHATAFDVAKAQGFFSSIVGRSYENYDRQLFEGTLNDLQWFGVGDPPAWYTGQPWS